MIQGNGHFKTAHTGWYLSAKAYGEVHLFETALHRALLWRPGKKRYLHAFFSTEFLRRIKAPCSRFKGYLLNH